MSWLLLALGCSTPAPGPDPAPPPAPDRRAETAPAHPASPGEAVVLVVMDTVRADHTSLCGYDRPTTPVLEGLAERGGAWCDVKAPGNWTVPSHASFFTGLHIVDHGAGMGRDRTNVEFGVRKMREDVPTAAEQLAERGFQTVLVSANGLVSEKTGLARGFAHTHMRSDADDLRGDRLRARLSHALAELDPDQPLFLVVNIIDAHDPWDAVPDGLDWVPPRSTRDAVQYARRIRRGRVRPERVAEDAPHFRDLYDYALFRADRVLGQVHETLDDGGWLSDRWRFVVTSDHGEYLGEHGRLLHNGPFLHEPVVRVPLVYLDSDGTTPDLPQPMSGIGVYDLVVDGTVPLERARDLRAAHLTSRPESKRGRGPCADVSRATWSDDGKLVCAAGTLTRVDLASDPTETHPTDVPFADEAGFMSHIEALETLNWGPMESASVDEQLEALGYIE